MAFRYTFKTFEDMRELRTLVDFVHQQDLGYPHYDDWVQRTETELVSGYKNAILAFTDGKLVGDAIYQPHKEMPFFAEIKNMRIHSHFRMRDFGRFILRQLELESENFYDALICDARASEEGIKKFLISCGFIPILTLPLYDSNVPDIVMVKFLRKGKEPILVSQAKNIIRQRGL